jgi:hypothetical protein
MDLPSDPTRHLLCTIAEVREALACVPGLLESGRVQEAHDLVDDMELQLAELWQLWDELPMEAQLPLGVTYGALLGGDDALALAAHRVARDADKPPLTRPGGRPGEDLELGYADVPLF